MRKNCSKIAFGGIDIFPNSCYNQTMDKLIKKKYPYVGKISETEGNIVSTYQHSSPWKHANTSFYWMNFEYPLYHRHTDWEIQIVLNDHILQYLNGKELSLYAGTAFLVGPKDQHALFYPNRKKNQFQGLCVIAKDEYVRKVLDLYSPTLYEEVLNATQSRLFNLPPSFLDELTNSFLEIQSLNNQSTPQAEEQCNILFQSLLLQFLKQRQTPSSMPSELATFIRSLNNPQLSHEEVKELQSDLPYSYSQLTRLFKKYTYCTITQYINNVKLEYAKELLGTTNMTTLMITNELHFESISHFNHLFKKQFNLTPTQYRKKVNAPK